MDLVFILVFRTVGASVQAEVPGLHTEAFGELGCRLLFYSRPTCQHCRGHTALLRVSTRKICSEHAF